MKVGVYPGTQENTTPLSNFKRLFSNLLDNFGNQREVPWNLQTKLGSPIMAHYNFFLDSSS